MHEKQNQVLVNSYCEGPLQIRCRRLQYKADFCKEAPDDLAPNGYLVGTHKKLKTDNTRRFERHLIKNGLCMLQVLDTPKKFSAGILDISEGGMRLALNVHPKELNICSEKSHLKILGYSIGDIPFPLTKEVVKMVWHDNQVIGCSFA